MARDGAPPGPLALTIRAEPASVREALGAVLAHFSLDADVGGTVELVLAEAMNNVVEHAYAGAGGTMDLALSPRRDGLLCELRDRGAPLPDGRMPLGRAMPADVPLPDIPEGGFGWFLIRQLAHELSHYRHDTERGPENVLTFRLAIGGACPSGAPP